MRFCGSQQALIYPLTVASKSALQARHNAANKILMSMCEHSQVLVQQAVMVGRPYLVFFTSLSIHLSRKVGFKK